MSNWCFFVEMDHLLPPSPLPPAVPEGIICGLVCLFLTERPIQIDSLIQLQLSGLAWNWYTALDLACCANRSSKFNMRQLLLLRMGFSGVSTCSILSPPQIPPRTRMQPIYDLMFFDISLALLIRWVRCQDGLNQCAQQIPKGQYWENWMWFISLCVCLSLPLSCVCVF